MKDLISQVDVLFSRIRSDFNELWSIRHRNSTVEFVTPYTTLSGDAVSVFITQRDNGYVVSDAGRVFDVASEQEVVLADRKTLHYAELIDKFGVKVVHQKESKRVFCYKTTNELTMVSSCIYDIALFQKALMDAILLDTMFASQESSDAIYFSRRVKETLREKVRTLSTDKQKYELYVDDNAKLFQFTTGVRKVGTPNRWLSMNIFCTNLQNFRRSVFRAEFGFKYVEKDPQLRLASVSDALPENLSSNRGVAVLHSAMSKWGHDYGVTNFTYADIEDLTTLETLFKVSVA